jgi:hypothetical protein
MFILLAPIWITHIEQHEKPIMKKLSLASSLIFLASMYLNAQTSSTGINQNIRLLLKTGILINLTSTTDTSISTEKADHYVEGRIKLSPSVFKVKSNRAWIITVDTTIRNLGRSAVYNTGTPLTDKLRLKTQIDSAPSSTALPPTTMIPSSAALAFNYNPRYYTTSVIYTATQQ